MERSLADIVEAVSSVDGAGVKLRRVFGFNERHDYDPFLLLDHFGSDNPDDYIAGFPWHPHRGIETVTYLLAGEVAHGDSMGNRGTIGPGDAQWMTAGSGIIHQEMPEPGADGRTMEGFQLWVNLPARLKMTEPRYRAVEAAEIPIAEGAGKKVAILAGEYGGRRGATPDLFVPVLYLIATLEPGASISLEVPKSHNAAAYVFRGRLMSRNAKNRGAASGEAAIGEGRLGHFPAAESPARGAGSPLPAEKQATDTVTLCAADTGASFLFIAGEPLGEPIAWGGPIVMNTREELRRAFDEYEAGTFVKSRG
ncbi:pirin family protein [bacterium]|nr:pirin family protein [bacterium]